MSVRTPAPQSAAQIILSAVKAATSTNFKLKDAYNLLAQVHGFKDWATAKAHLDVTPAEELLVYARSSLEIRDWPTFLVTEDRAEASDNDELFLYPLGCTLENMAARRYSGNVVKDLDVELKLLSEFFPKISKAEMAQHVIVEKVWSRVPQIEKYSIPPFSVEALAGQFFSEWYGWGYASFAEVPYASLMNGAGSAVECLVVDSGDDSSARWWVQLRISPQLASRIEEACKAQDYVHNED